MDKRVGVETHNWFGDIHARPTMVVRPTSEAELISVVKDAATYPSPVRAAGSNHSTTRCVVADAGTVVDMRGMNRIVAITGTTVTAQAGALYIDVAKALEAHGLQFHVNIELGNLTMGSAACTHTKDASFPGEYGIVSSYAVGMKSVLPSGEVLVVTEGQPELLQAMRTSFGLLGVVFEVTFRVKPLRPLAFHHESFRLEDFERRLPELRERGESIMYFLFPFESRITVEFRRYLDEGTARPSFGWRFRNFGWRTIAPTSGRLIRAVPSRAVRNVLFDGGGPIVRGVMGLVKARGSRPADQMIRYPERAGFDRYTFSIWAFPEERFPRVAGEYGDFSREYNRTAGYRCDLPHVGYRIAQDTSSLFSYTYHGTAMTIDPVSTAGPGWPEFLDAYNAFCSRHGGSPLFNQTARLTPAQVRESFGPRLETFRALQRRYDPASRFVNRYFAELLELPGAPDARAGGTPES